MIDIVHRLPHEEGAGPLLPPSTSPTWGTVLLRSFTDADVSMLRDLATDPYVPTIGSLPFRADEAEALAYVVRQRGRVEEGVGWSFCIADRTSGQALGGAGLWLVRDDPHRMTAGYAVAPRARGCGVAGQALRALTTFAWSLPDVARVELFVEPWNVASLRTAVAAGYVRETVLHGEEVRGRSADLVRLAVSRPSDHP